MIHFPEHNGIDDDTDVGEDGADWWEDGEGGAAGGDDSAGSSH